MKPHAIKPVNVASLLAFFFLLVLSACSEKDPPPDNIDRSLQLHSFTPSHATRGTTIVLRGKNFSTAAQNNLVRFQNDPANAPIVAASATELSVVVPPLATTGKIRLTVGNQTVESATDFVVDAEPEPAVIVDFNPKQGPAGTIVTISGARFGNDIRVTLNNVEAVVTQNTVNEIVFTIPSDPTLTSHKIKVVSDGTVLETASNFTVTTTPPARWISKNVNTFPTPGFQFGLSFVYHNKIYWGFSKFSSNQTHTDYMVLDPTAPNPQWQLGPQPPADMAPASLQRAVAVVHDDKVYIGTGLAPAATKKWWRYNPETNTSIQLADYPDATAHALSFVMNNKIYVGFGGNNKKMYAYNPITNLWTLDGITDAQEISDASAFVIANKAFIGRVLPTVGGLRQDFLQFTGTSTWMTPVAGLPESMQSPETPSFTLDSKGYFVTGYKVWEYTPDPFTGGSWRLVINNANGPSITHTATVSVNGTNRVYGWNNYGDVYEFRLN